MHRTPVRVRSPDDQRLAILKAELEDLDHMLPVDITPFRKGSPVRKSPGRKLGPSPRRAESVVDISTPTSALRPYVPLSVRPKTGDDKKAMLDNYQYALADHAVAKRQLGYLSKEVASIVPAGRKAPSSYQRTPPSSPQQHYDSFEMTGSVGRGNIDHDLVRRRVETRIGSQSPRQSPKGMRMAGSPGELMFIDHEAKHRENELADKERRLQAMQRKQAQDNDGIKQAAMLLRHSLATSTSGNVTDHVLAAQNALDILDDIKGDGVMHGFDERLRQRIEDHEQAKSRIREARINFEQAMHGEREDKIVEMLARHELAAVAAEGVKKEHTKKVMALTRQLCDKQAEYARMEEIVKQKSDQLKAAHDALAHTTSQLAAVTDTTKEMQKLQEEKQAMNKELCEKKDEVTIKDRKIKQLATELESCRVSAETVRAAETKCSELTDLNAVANADLQNMQSALEEQEAQIIQLQQTLQGKTDGLEAARQQLKDFERNLELVNKENDSNRRKALETKAAWDAATTQLSSVERELAENEERVARLTEQLQASSGEVHTLSRNVKELAHQLESANLEVATMKASCDSLKDENSSLRESLKMEQGDRANGHRELTQLTMKCNELTRHRDDLEKRLREKESLESIQQEDLYRKDNQAGLLMKELREKTAELERKQREFNVKDAEVKKREMTLAEREGMLQTMETELINKRQELGHSVVSHTISNSKIAELTQALEGKDLELSEVKSENIVLAENLRSLQIDHEEDLEKRIQLEQVVEMVRNQLAENTVQFGALTEDLHNTRTRLDVEISQHEILEEQVRLLSDTNATLTVQNKELESDNSRMLSTTSQLDANLERKDGELVQLRAEYERDVNDLRQKVIECGSSLGLNDANQQEMIKNMQNQLVHAQTQADDSMKNASTMWSAIARLGRKFDEYERNHQLRATRPVHEKFEDACSFLRYLRGWWSMYKEKDPAAIEDAANTINAVNAANTINAANVVNTGLVPPTQHASQQHVVVQTPQHAPQHMLVQPPQPHHTLLRHPLYPDELLATPRIDGVRFLA